MLSPPTEPRVLDTDHNKLLIEQLLPMESAKKALRIFEKYDTLSEIYFDGQGYADTAKLDNVGKYHHVPICGITLDPPVLQFLTSGM